MGAPILEGKALDKALQEKIADLELSVEHLSLLQANDALCLLKNALAMPKLQFILRTSPCCGNPLLSTFDGVLPNGLSKILNIELNDSQWKQASLPVQMGGLGVRSVCMLTHSAFLGSAAATQSLQIVILPKSFHDTEDPMVSSALVSWKSLMHKDEPIDEIR